MGKKIKNNRTLIIINAGHYDDPKKAGFDDPGATVGHDIKEAEECMRIRDLLEITLKDKGYDLAMVPDELDLSESILWANEKIEEWHNNYGSDKGVLAIDIHLNYLSDTNVRGTEAFFNEQGDEKDEEIAEVMAKKMADRLDIPNRGGRPDTWTDAGQLGWLRQITKARSVLVEGLYLSNEKDLEILGFHWGREKIALGIVDAIEELGIEPPGKKEEEKKICLKLRPGIRGLVKNILELIRLNYKNYE